MKCKVVDRHGAIVPTGTSGELWTKGYNVMIGYWNDANKTKEVLHEGWMKTGDLAVIDSEGFCSIVGRKKVHAEAPVPAKRLAHLLRSTANNNDVRIRSFAEVRTFTRASSRSSSSSTPILRTCMWSACQTQRYAIYRHSPSLTPLTHMLVCHVIGNKTRSLVSKYVRGFASRTAIRLPRNNSRPFASRMWHTTRYYTISDASVLSIVC